MNSALLSLENSVAKMVAFFGGQEGTCFCTCHVHDVQYMYALCLRVGYNLSGISFKHRPMIS